MSNIIAVALISQVKQTLDKMVRYVTLKRAIHSKITILSYTVVRRLPLSALILGLILDAVMCDVISTET